MLGQECRGPYRTAGRHELGKNIRGLERAAAMTLEVYMTLAALKHPSPEVKQSKAQLIQNYRALHQASMDGGSWEQAWLFTGLPEPLRRKRWAAPNRQVSIVAGFLKARNELSKQMLLPASGDYRLAENDDLPAQGEVPGRCQRHDEWPRQRCTVTRLRVLMHELRSGSAAR